MNKNIGGLLMLGLAAFIWGTAFVAQSTAMDYMGPFTFNGVRFLLGGLVLLPVVVLRGRRNNPADTSTQPRQSGRTLLKGGLVCGAVLFVCSCTQQVGISFTTVGKAGFITALYIVIVPVLGLFLGRRVPLLQWGCILLATVGMYLLCITEGFSINPGDALMVACALCFAGHILVLDHFVKLVDVVKLSCLQFFVCGTLSLATAFIVETPALGSVLAGYMPILYTGILSCGVAYTLQALGQKRVKPVAASLILSMEAVFSAIFGWLLLGEALSLRELLGCAVIFAAILLAQLPSPAKKPANQ